MLGHGDIVLVPYKIVIQGLLSIVRVSRSVVVSWLRHSGLLGDGRWCRVAAVVIVSE